MRSYNGTFLTSNGPLAFCLPLVYLRLRSLTIWASSSLSNNYSSCIYKLLDAINLLLVKAGTGTNAIFTSSVLWYPPPFPRHKKDLVSFVHPSVEYQHWYGTIGWYVYMSAECQSPRNRHIGRLLVTMSIAMLVNTWPSVSQPVDRYVGLYMSSTPANTWLADTGSVIGRLCFKIRTRVLGFSVVRKISRFRGLKIVSVLLFVSSHVSLTESACRISAVVLHI